MTASRFSKPDSLLASLTIALGIAAGALILWILVVQLLSSTFVVMFRRDYDWRSLEYNWFRSGEPFSFVRNLRRGRLAETSTLDLNGNPLADIKQVEPHPTGTGFEAHLSGISELPRSPMGFIAKERSGRHVWYAVRDLTLHDSCWLECYDVVSSQRMYCVGVDGKVDDVPHPEKRFRISEERFKRYAGWNGFGNSPFPDYQYDDADSDDAHLFLGAEDHIFRVNLVSGEVHSLLPSPPRIISFTVVAVTSIGRASQSLFATNPEMYRVLIRTSDQLLMYAGDGKKMSATPLQSIDSSESMNIREYSQDGSTSERYLHSSWNQKSADIYQITTRIWKLNDDYQYKPDEPLHHLSWQNHSLGMTLNERCLAAGIALPAPALLAGATVFPPDRFIDAPYRTSPTAVIVVILLTMMAFLLFRQDSARHVIADRGVWLTFVLLFGLFGFLGYRCCRKWKIRSIPTDSSVAPNETEMFRANTSVLIVPPTQVLLLK